MRFLLRWVVEVVPAILRFPGLGHALNLELQVHIELALEPIHIVSNCLLLGLLELLQMHLLLLILQLFLHQLLLNFVDFCFRMRTGIVDIDVLLCSLLLNGAPFSRALI